MTQAYTPLYDDFFSFSVALLCFKAVLYVYQSVEC